MFDGDFEMPIRRWIEWPAVRSLLPDLTGKRLLVAGYGAGTFSHRFADADAGVVAIDVSAEMIDRARVLISDRERSAFFARDRIHCRM